MSGPEFELLTEPERLTRRLADVYRRSSQLHLMYAWADSNAGQASHWCTLPLDKVKRALIGVGFLGSEPRVLRELHRRGKLRVARSPDGTFHPKLIIGTRGDQGCAIFGSSNFTTGGFERNTELNAFIAGPLDSGPLRDALNFFDEHWEKTPEDIPGTWLDDYEARFAAKSRPERPPPMRSRKPTRRRGGLDISWPAFVHELQKKHDIADGVDVLGQSVAAFDTHRRFIDLDMDTIKNVAGWNDGPDGHGGWFGSMRAAGHFKAICASTPEVIGKHLDRVPVSGEVTECQVRTYLDGMLAIPYIGLSGATRLLLSKRPDRFLCVNAANVDWLRKATNIDILLTKAAGAVDRYMELLSYVYQCAWYTSPRPRDNRGRSIWDGRVALVDRLACEYNR